MRKIICAAISLSMVLQFLSLAGCKGKERKYTDYAFDYFDTVTTIIGFEKSEEIFKENCDRIKKKLEEYHKLYTIYGRYEGINNLTTVNETVEGKHNKVKVDKKITEMLSFSKQMYDMTAGKVNVALGSALSIWHRYREAGIEDPSSAELPKIDDLKAAAEHTDINDVIIDTEKDTVFLSDPEMLLDVGAVAKGYAVQRVALWMESEGITGYLLNVGGNIRIVGERKDGGKWQIGIENPDSEEIPYIEYLELGEMSVVTSGSYQRYYTVDGKNYHHIIDPDTLMPSDRFRLVSVLCEDSGMADALSTALFSMSYEEGKALIESLPDTYALWLTNDGEKMYSKGFKDFCRQ